MRLRLLAQTCVAQSLTSANPGLVLLKLKYFIFWYGLLSLSFRVYYTVTVKKAFL